MTEIAIIGGSTRPGRRSRAVAEWVAAQAARRHPSAGFGLVYLADFALQVLDTDAFDVLVHLHEITPTQWLP